MGSKNNRKTTPSFKFNPFSVTGFEIKHKDIKSDEELVEHKVTKKLYALRPLDTSTTIVDTLPYTKLFHKGLDLMIKESLTLSEYKLIMYIARNLKPKTDEIFIDLEDCLKSCGWEQSSIFYTTVRNLIKKEIIAKSVKGNTTFWINPDFLYNGNRNKLYNLKEQESEKLGFLTNIKQ